MEKNTYIKLLECYYDIEDGTLIRLGYGEGNDTLRLAIGKRRNRFIENIDAKYLYLIVYQRVDEEFGEYRFREYRKYDPQIIDGEYVIDVQALLKELDLSYRELDSKEFSRTRKFEKVSPSDSIYPYAYGYYRYYKESNAHFISMNYCKNSFMIGNREVHGIYGKIFNDDKESFKFLMEACEKEIQMDVDDFTKFLETARCMNSLDIVSGDVSIGKEEYGDLWTYVAWLENGEEEERVTYRVDLKEKNAGVILYNMWKCTDYQQYQNLITKIKFLGL